MTYPMNRIPLRSPRPTDAVAAYRKANEHTGIAIRHRRAGDDQKAWEHSAYVRFYRTAALGHLNGV